jgi:predicted permease
MPRWLLQFRVALRSLLRPRRADRELNEELAYHLDRDVHERMQVGLPAREARRAAVRAMGPLEMNREACRDLRPGNGLLLFVGRVAQDLRFALRLFRKHPVPVGIAIGGLALAIGVVTAVFSIVNATLLRPFGMDDPSSVIGVTEADHPARWPVWSYPDFLRMRAGTRLARLEAAESRRARVSRRAKDEAAASRHVLFVSGGYLALFGGRPAFGRTLGPVDDLASAPPAIVVSHHFWRTELGGDAAVVGTTVWVNDAPATLVGVLQPGFTGPNDAPIAMFATLAAFDDLQMGPAVTPDAGPEVAVVGRLAAGATRQALQDNLAAALNPSGAPRTSETGHGHGGVLVQRASSPIDGPASLDVYIVLTVIVSLVGMVLALACANVANLLMASAWTRMREVGVRLALGATRRRLVMQMVTESLLLGTTAGVFGFLLAFWLVPVFGTLVEVSPEVSLAPDGRALVFTFAVALICGLGAGLAPARHGARGAVAAALQAQSGARGAAALPSRLRTSFMGLQAALSMLLLVLAALFARSAIRMTSVDIGFDADRLLGVTFDVPRSNFDEPAYVGAALAAVKSISSVERVSVSLYAPFGGVKWSDRFVHEGRSFDLSVMPADAEFFATTGARILRGRAFTADEVAREEAVVLISQSVAQAFFAPADPIGRSLSAVPSETGLPQPPATIIGVVADALVTRVDGEVYGAIYRPLSQQRANPPALIVRSATPGATQRDVEAALRRIDPRVDVATRLVRDGLDSFLSVRRRLAWVLGPAAAISLVLAGLGIYGVTAFVVGLRTEEVSVRMALGASAGDVLRLLLTDSLRPVAAGLTSGLAVALAVSRLLAAEELPGINPFDPVAIVVALAALFACALLATVAPARRAARVDPAQLLRQS